MLKIVTPEGETLTSFVETASDEYYINIANHLHEGQPLNTSPESARRALAVVEAAERSFKSGSAEKVSRLTG